MMYREEIKKRAKNVYLSLRKAVFSVPRLCVKNIQPVKSDINKILLIRIDRIGDMVLSIPFFTGLKKTFPETEIVLLARPFARSLIKCGHGIDKIIYARGSFRETAFILENGAFDLAVDMHCDYTLETARLCLASRAKYRAGFDIAGRWIFFNIQAQCAGRKHFIDETFDLLAAVGGRPHLNEPFLAVDRESQKSAEEFLKEKNIASGDRLVVIHPGGYYPCQRWPAERFADTADVLVNRYRAKVIVMAADNERDIVEEILSRCPLCVEYIGQDLGKVSALLSKAGLFMGNNSGPLHMACALGIPAISVMGPTDYIKWKPVGSRNIVLRKTEGCYACANGFGSGHTCMSAVAVSDVLNAIEDFFRKK